MSAENGKVFAAPPGPLAITAPNAAKKRATGGAALLSNGSALNKLASLTPARDLTLGGRGGSNAPKKVFTPNLNVVRNKNANVKTSKDTTARGRGGRSERGRGGRGRGGGGGSSSLIQTTGVFSEGAGAVNIRKTASSSSSSFSRSADDTPSAMRKPTLIKSEHRKIDLKADAEHVRELLGDSDEDDFVDEKTDLEQIPIKLNEAKWKYVKSEIKVEVSDENGAANEDDSALAIAQKIQALHVQQQDQQHRTHGSLPRYPQSVDELLRLTQPQIFLLQLPDALPCEDEPSDSPEKAADGTAKMDTTNDASTTPPAKNNTSKRHTSLKQLEEGQVGKLLRYKSGKIKLVFGETYFDLDMGMETGFLQDLMSISTNREERSGNMINLGAIQAKLSATPDWEHLLKHQLSEDHA